MKFEKKHTDKKLKKVTMKLRLFNGILGSLLTMLFMGLFLAFLLQVSPLITIGALFILSFIPLAPAGVLREGVLKELWTAELINHFRHEHMWLSRIPSADQYVDNDVIHLVDVGADPKVLINNNTYPIPVVDRDDEDIAIKLHLFETENTRIRKKDLYALPYDKEGSVLRQHREALEEETAVYGLHSLAPSGNTVNTPIINTTGADNGNNRKRLQIADIVKLKKMLDDLKVPKRDRLLVLCSDHIEDLLLVSEAFRNQYKDIPSGKVLNMFGFEIYESTYNPIYDGANAKKAYGAASAGTDRNGSVAIFAPRAFKAKGSVGMYATRAEDDPHNRASVLGFDLRHLVLPKKNTGFAALVSDSI